MSLEGNMEYALARVQAQYGVRLTPNDWRRLEASHDLGQYLEVLRNSTFSGWVSAIDRGHDAHAIERSLRAAWRRYVGIVATWHPREWQPWLTWLEWLPMLPLLAELARPEPAPAWLTAEPVIGPAAGRSLPERNAVLKRTPLEAFAPGVAGSVPIPELWLARWKALQPPADPMTLQYLSASSRAVMKHRRQLQSENADGTALRAQLAGQLMRLLRAAGGTVVVTLCYLALMALDYERLRGGLVNRALFTASNVR
jgi:hypothetical protein